MTSNHTCEDINECEVDNGDCEANKYKCINNDGSFECDCLDGFTATIASKDWIQFEKTKKFQFF